MRTHELYQVYLRHRVVTTDSRRITPGSLFFALKGGNFDGNRFAAAALDAGAACAVVDDPEVATDGRFFLVDDVLTALQELARHHRTRLGLPILAITGTNGKTTTKELVAAVLSRKFRVTFTQGNLNNHIGVPLTLLGMTHETDLGVVEMGANHPGEIAFLCAIALPDYGLITNVGKAHLEGFGSFEGVLRTKSELYRHLEEHHGTIFINARNPWLSQSAGPRLARISYRPGDPAETGLLPPESSGVPAKECVTAGTSGGVPAGTAGKETGYAGAVENAAGAGEGSPGVEWGAVAGSGHAGSAAAGDSMAVTGFSSGTGPLLEVRACWQGVETTIPTRLVGNYNLENVLAAIAVGSHFGVPPADIAAALAAYSPSNNRSQWMKTGTCEIIMDAYNANPTSMLAAVRNFVTLHHPRKMVILGDMLELGAVSAEEHQRITDELSLHFREGVLLCGEAFCATHKPVEFKTFPHVAGVISWLREHPPADTLLLIKGSRGMQLEKIVDALSE